MAHEKGHEAGRAKADLEAGLTPEQMEMYQQILTGGQG